MTVILKKSVLILLKIIIVPSLAAVAVWTAFHIVGGEMVRVYQGPSIWAWLGGVLGRFDFGMAGEWMTSGQKAAPYLWQGIRNTGLIALTAISLASLFSIAWTYLVWNNPYNAGIRVVSGLLRFFSSWPILIGAIFVAVIIKAPAFTTLIMPAIILAICDNNLNDFRDNLMDEIKEVMQSDYAIAALGQGRSFFRNLVPEIFWKVISFIASRLPAVVSGIIVLELYFNINGIYQYLMMFYRARDLNAILGITFLVSFCLTAWSSIFAVVYSIIDPRQR
jgi:ABC-type dipeptide/oligopeptide/nickel transport system permease component